MMDKLLHCKNGDCTITECKRHLVNLNPLEYGRCVCAHLEDNPMYCQKANWNGYRAKEDEDGQ